MCKYFKQRFISFVHLVLIQLIFCHSLMGQDVIRKMNGEMIKSKVIDITITDVRYRNINDGTDSIRVLSKKDLAGIDFQNGVVIVFNTDSVPAEVLDSAGYRQGKRDAVLYYKGYKPAATGTLITSLVSPIYGLIPATICSANKPKPENLNIPPGNLSQNLDYLKGYQEMAGKMKSRKVWQNYGIGSGIYAGVFAILIVIVISSFSSE